MIYKKPLIVGLLLFLAGRLSPCVVELKTLNLYKLKNDPKGGLYSVPAFFSGTYKHKAFDFRLDVSQPLLWAIQAKEEEGEAVDPELTKLSMAFRGLSSQKSYVTGEDSGSEDPSEHEYDFLAYSHRQDASRVIIRWICAGILHLSDNPQCAPEDYKHTFKFDFAEHLGSLRTFMQRGIEEGLEPAQIASLPTRVIKFTFDQKIANALLREDAPFSVLILMLMPKDTWIPDNLFTAAQALDKLKIEEPVETCFPCENCLEDSDDEQEPPVLTPGVPSSQNTSPTDSVPGNPLKRGSPEGSFSTPSNKRGRLEDYGFSIGTSPSRCSSR